MAGFDPILSVSKLNEYVSLLLKNDARLNSIRVKGELTGFKRHTSGHLYFSIKDENALIRCVMFKSNAERLRFAPRDGVKVVLTGSVSIYVKDGQYQFYATSMTESGDGELFRQFIELKNRLDGEGLFAKKRPLPYLPKCVGIVTSETGAALKDIQTVIARRFPTMNLLLAPALVQGADAPRSIADAIRLLNDDGTPDVIIVGRGGGSYEELSCFNDEAVARAIFESEIPTVSAVGHEVDFTIADFVADLRAPTPSAAAEICVPELESLMAWLAGSTQALINQLNSAVSVARRHIELLMSDSVLSRPGMLIELKRGKLQSAVDSMERAAAETITACYSKLDLSAKRLDALNPYAVLGRGYAIVSDADGTPIQDAAAVKSGMKLDIRLENGSVGATAD